MLSNTAGILAVSAIIGDVPEKYSFAKDGSGEGLLLAQDILAKAHGVPLEKVHCLKPGLRINIDDMACSCIYSKDCGFSVAVKDMHGLVLEEHVTGRTGRSYHPHKEAEESSSKNFTGVKGRHTYLLTDRGHMGPIWLQIPDLSEEELPYDKIPTGVLLVAFEGLTSVSSYSYDVHVCFCIMVYVSHDVCS